MRVDLKHERNFQLGMEYAKQSQYAEALDYFKTLLAKSSSYLPDLLTLLYKLQINRINDVSLGLLIADLCVWGKRYKEAVLDLEMIVEADPFKSQSYLLLSKIYRKNEEKDAVKEIFEKAFFNNILDSTILDLLPGMYLEESNIDKSIAVFERLLEKKPEVIHYYKTLAGLYEKAGQYEQAATIIQKAASLSPSCVGDAVEQCEALIRLSPQNTMIRRILVELHIKSYNPLAAVNHTQSLVSSIENFETEAVEIYRSILSLYPDNLDALKGLSKVYITLGRYSEAVECLKQVFELKSDEFQDIVFELDHILEAYPSQLMALQLKADMYYKTHQLRDCLSVLDRLIELEFTEDAGVEERLAWVIQKSPEFEFECRYRLAMLYFSRNEDAKCVQECKKCFGSIFDEKVRLLYAKTEVKDGNLKQAIHILFETLGLYPHSFSVHEQLKEYQTQFIQQLIEKHQSQEPKNYFEMGLLYLKQGEVWSALEHFQKVTPQSHHFSEAQLVLNRCFLEINQYEWAINQLNRLLQTYQNDIKLANKLRFFLGIYSIHNAQVLEGLKHLESILEFDITFPYIQTILGYFRRESIGDLRGKALSGCLGPDMNSINLMSVQNKEESNVQQSDLQKISFAYPHNNQGIEFLLKSHFKAAEDEFTLAMQMDPNLTVVYCNVALLFAIQKEYKISDYYLQKALELNPKLDLVYLNKALVQMLQKKWADAAQNLEMTLKLNPENYVAKLNLADAYFYSGNVEKAFYYYIEASKMGLLFPYVQRRLLYLNSTLRGASDWLNDFYYKVTDFLPIRREA